MASSIKWDASEITRGLAVYRSKVHEACLGVANYFAPVIEAEAKTNASWTDRTGNARQGLTGFVEDLSETLVALYLAHRVLYGIHLELRNSARYAIILPTLENHYSAIFKMLQDVLG